MTREEAIENIDIGGPSMVRSAAKNHAAVAVVVSPSDYPAVLDELQENDGALSQETRTRLAVQAFAHTAAYDATITTTWPAQQPHGGGQRFPDLLTLSLSRKCRTCATARTRTSRRPSTVSRRRRAASRRQASCTARSCRSTTSTT